MLSVDALISLVSIIDSGSFSAAADRLGQTPSGVSRTISRLEAQLGMTLIKRTTRRLDLTEEGEWLLARARKIISDLQDTEDQLAARLSQPSGLVRLNAATPVLDHLIAPLMADFLDAYPLVRLELISGETVVDLIDERADLAIRIGPLADSTLNARQLGSSRLRVLASPAYLAAHGTPSNVEALMRHRLLGFTAPNSLNIWPLPQEGGDGLPVLPVIAASSGETLRHLALTGGGVVCLADFLTRQDVLNGNLIPILESETLPWSQRCGRCSTSRKRWPLVFLHWSIFWSNGSLGTCRAFSPIHTGSRMQSGACGGSSEWRSQQLCIWRLDAA